VPTGELLTLACAILKAEVRRMKDSVSSHPTLETPADYEAAIEECLAEIRRLNEQMQNDRRDIERLKAETHALKTETQKLKAETRASLTRLGAEV
jgi:predicted RNase H-like nuclease (RuvC/YqgF family)